MSTIKIVSTANNSNGLWRDSECEKFEVQDKMFPSLQYSDGRSEWLEFRKKACQHISDWRMDFEIFFARFLAFYLKPATVLEFECGLGLLSDFLAQNVPGGSHVTCLKNDLLMRELFVNRRLPHRPTQLQGNFVGKEHRKCANEIIEEGFDLVLSLSLEIQTLTEKDNKNLATLLARSTKRLLVFSASHMQKDGDVLVERDKWIKMFESRGLVYIPNLTNMAARFIQPERGADFASGIFIMRNPEFKYDDATALSGDDALYFEERFFPWQQKTIEVSAERGKPRVFRGNVKVEKSFVNDFDRDEVLPVKMYASGRSEFIQGSVAALWPEMDKFRRDVLDWDLKCEELL